MRIKKPDWITQKRVLLAIVLGIIGANWVSWNHAWHMTHFTSEGERTKSPEVLTWLEKVPLLIFGITVPRPQNNETPADFDLNYETIIIDSGEHQLEGWIIPASTNKDLGTVLLFHGYAGAKQSMLTEAQALHQMGYTTMLIDFRGSGGSTGNETTVGYSEADDVVSAFQFAQSHGLQKPIYLYGLSMGGAAIMRAIATTNIMPDGLIVEAVFDEMLSTIENRFDAMGVPSFPAARLLVFWGGVQSGFNGFRHNPADYASNITIPVLMLHGQNDPRATLAQGERSFNKLTSSNKKMVVFSEAGHESSINIDKALWEFEVAKFLQEATN